MRARKQNITDITLSVNEVKRIKKGYRIYKRRNGHAHAIYVKTIDSTVVRKIDKLKARIKALRNRLIEVKHVS